MSFCPTMSDDDRRLVEELGKECEYWVLRQIEASAQEDFENALYARCRAERKSALAFAVATGRL